MLIHASLFLQKRAELRARLDLGRYETDSDAEPAEAKPAGKNDEQAYRSNRPQATVTVAPFSLNSDRWVVLVCTRIYDVWRCFHACSSMPWDVTTV